MTATRLPWAPLATSDIVRQQTAWGTVYGIAGKEELVGPLQAVVALGAFDGLHRGHRVLVRAARDDARRRGVPCAIVTFDPDPAEVVGTGTQNGRLLSVEDRCAGLLGLGADYALALSFTPAFAAKPPKDFANMLLNEVVRPVSIHVGNNFRFGSRGAGTTRDLARLGKELGFSVVAHELVGDDGSPVSATRIRGLLANARLEEANHLLERCHYVRGRVAHGRGEGTQFGFPTANVVCDVRTCMPHEGVYACYVTQGTHAWPAAVNVGAPPTFSEPVPAFLEANLLGFTGDLYNTDVAVSFVAWLRASRPFDSLEELERVVMGNIAWVRDNLGNNMLEVGR